jgi:hypothetical protein
LLGLLVEQYLAFAETMAQQVPMYMKDWIERLDIILQLNGRELLHHAEKSVTNLLWKRQTLNLTSIVKHNAPSKKKTV